MSELEILKQGSRTQEFKPVVKLTTASMNPVGTLFCIWHGSRNAISLNPEIVQNLYERSQPFDGHSAQEYEDTEKEIIRAFPDAAKKYDNDIHEIIKDIVVSVLKYNIPPSESVQFTFEIDSANVAWREQLVRGRLAQNFWTQSTRPMDLRTMDVSMNKSIELFGGEEGVKLYKDTVEMIRECYRQLVAMGVPQEDIRLQPQMHIHRVYWFVSFRSLLTVLSKRCDWIAQASLWLPIVSGCVEILREYGMGEIIDDFIGHPMCTAEYDPSSNGYRITDYKNIQDCEARMSGADPAPIDPLYLAYTGKSMPQHTDIEFYDYLKSMFIQIWSDEYLEVLGWDRSNPTKLGKYDRPVM